MGQGNYMEVHVVAVTAHVLKGKSWYASNALGYSTLAEIVHVDLAQKNPQHSLSM